MYKQEKVYYKRAFFYALLMAVILLVPFVAVDQGMFIFYGDFNAQQIPFYKTCINAIHDGSFGWNWQTDLGANFVGSYSFYTLGSPFFWFAALFPASISHYLMAPLLALKLALSSLFAFIYIRRFVTKPYSALVGGILYAFSGFSLYNIFFNHFHEAIVFFPLLLIGLEECVINKRRGVFALAVALNAFVNYFFFIGECVFLVIYFIARLCCDSRFRIKAGDFFCLAFESVVGVAIAGVLFVPSIFQVLDVPRSTNILTDTSFLFYTREQRYGLLLEAMFFPPSVSARNIMFPDAGAKWSSVALYLPLFSMAGVIAFIKGAKKHWAKAVLVVCLVMAFVPGLNAAFTMFNNNFYTRWFYMPELICCLASVYAVEKLDNCDLKFGLKFSAVAAGVTALLVLLYPTTHSEEITNAEGVTETIESIRPNVMQLSPAAYVQFAICITFLILMGLLIRAHRKSPREFPQTLLTLTIVSSMLLGYYFVGYGRILGPYVGSYNRTVNADIHIDDPEFYRMEALGEINNANMLWDMSSLKSFTSIIPNATFELYDMLDITRDVNSAPEESRYALRSLTRVKYLMVHKDYDKEKLEKALGDLAVYEFFTSQGEYDIYINNYALPMGYAYDSYVLKDDISSHSAIDKLMCRAVVLTKEQAEKYSSALSKIGDEERRVVTLEQFKEDAESRIAAGVSGFSITNSGFTAKTDYDTDELVVFSVPYDSGWSATVNGQPAEIEKVNGGFVSVYVSAGESDIVFTYTTPGIKLGLMATVCGTALLGLYLLIIYVFMRRRPQKYVHLYAEEQSEGIRAHEAYINQLSRQIYSAHDAGIPVRPEATEHFIDDAERLLERTKEKHPTTYEKNEGDDALRIIRQLDIRIQNED
ncbi:MAG: YfhO family protein [Oscillospiraceae bacterium]|nr:YfhO family protein [Oscillospiraceae bacterium]